MTTNELPTDQGYDIWAPFYDTEGNPMLAADERVVHAALGGRDLRDQEILDLGCGTGRNALWLAAHDARVTGVDFSAGMLAEARKKDPSGRVDYVRHDLGQPLPFEAGGFSLVVSSLVLEHLPDLTLFFSEVRRMLAPGGFALVTAMHPAMLLRGKRAAWTDPTTGEKVLPAGHPHQVSDFVNALTAAGLRLQRMEEVFGDEVMAQAYPRAEKYVGWPLVVAFHLEGAP